MWKDIDNLLFRVSKGRTSLSEAKKSLKIFFKRSDCCKKAVKNSANYYENKIKRLEERIQELEGEAQKLRHFRPTVDLDDKEVAAKYRSLVTRQKKKFSNVEGLISAEEYENMLKSPCKYCGDPATGIDRVDNSLGYIENNCVPCCRTCNIAKNTLPVNDFLDHCDKISEFRAQIRHIS